MGRSGCPRPREGTGTLEVTKAWPGCKLQLCFARKALRWGVCPNQPSVSGSWLPGGYGPCDPSSVKTPARRKKAGRGLWHPNLTTSTPSQPDTGIWGSKACMRRVPLAVSPLPEASRLQVLCAFHSLRRFPEEQPAQRGHGGCPSLHVEHPGRPQLHRESKYGLYRDEVGALAPLRALVLPS